MFRKESVATHGLVLIIGHIVEGPRNEILGWDLRGPCSFEPHLDENDGPGYRGLRKQGGARESNDRIPQG